MILVGGALALAAKGLPAQAQAPAAGQGQAQGSASAQGQAQSQTPPSSGSEDIDNLFNGSNGSNSGTGNTTGPVQGPGPASGQSQGQAGPGPTQTAPNNQQPGAGQGQTQTGPPSLRPDDILNDHKLHFFGSLDLYGNLGGGIQESPDFSMFGNRFGYDVGGSFNANLGFEIRPVSELRIRAKLTYEFPGFTSMALPELSEMFFDYSLLNAVFFRMGIFSYTWGNSQFFQYGNLPGRSEPGWSGLSTLPLWAQTNLLITIPTQNYPVSLKMAIPMGLNTLTMLARFDLANYGNPPMQASPSPKDAGYGIQYDLVTGPIEWSLAGFYQWQMNPRALLAMKTSILGFDVSAESTVASPVSVNLHEIYLEAYPGGGIYVGGALQYIYPTAVVGISREWVDAGVKVYAEYGYNGERAPGESWLQDETGPGGHNTAVGTRLANLGGSGIVFNFLWQQNWSDGSGLVGPFIEFAPIGPASIQAGVPYLWGSSSSEVAQNRLVPGSQGIEFLLLVKISESFQQ